MCVCVTLCVCVCVLVCAIVRLMIRSAASVEVERCCNALKRQRKPIRQHTHRTICLKHVQRVGAIVQQVCV